MPDPSRQADPARRGSMEKALRHMDLAPGQRIEGLAINRVFIGSCTNSRLEDLRAAAQVARGRKAIVPALVVPGSGLAKRAAEAEGLDRVFFEGRQGKGARTHLMSPAMAAAAAVTGRITDVRRLLA